MEIRGRADDDGGAPALAPGAGVADDQERGQHAVHHARSQQPSLRARHVPGERRVPSEASHVSVFGQLLHDRLVQRVAAGGVGVRGEHVPRRRVPRDPRAHEGRRRYVRVHSPERRAQVQAVL